MDDSALILRFEWCKSKARINNLKLLCEKSDKIEVLNGKETIYQTNSVDCLLAFLLGYEYRNSKVSGI
jgi:hypothetical protein